MKMCCELQFIIRASLFFNNDRNLNFVFPLVTMYDVIHIIWREILSVVKWRSVFSIHAGSMQISLFR